MFVTGIYSRGQDCAVIASTWQAYTLILVCQGVLTQKFIVLSIRFQEEDQSFTPKEAADLRPKVDQLKAEYEELIELAKAKSETLKAKQTLHELQQDLSEMDQWIITKLELLKR